MGNDDAAIEFLYFGAKNDSVMYAALTLTKDDDVPHLIPLFEEKQLAGISKGDYYKTASLSNLVWAPLNEVLKGKKNIYFAPAGELHNIAIETIPRYNGEGLMSDHWNLYRLSSTRQLALIKDKNEMKEAYVYGGLSYDMEVKDVVANAYKYADKTSGLSRGMVNIADSLQMHRSANVPALEPLPGTKVEAQNIDRSLRELAVHSTLLTDTLGTEASFKALSGSRPNVLHIATHGHYWPESEAKNSDLSIMAMLNDDSQSRYVEDKALTRSALFFAGAENAFDGEEMPEGIDDGILTAKEISTLDLRGLELVVLSACQTGLGEITGDGVFGLQRGFKKAGANAMLMSLRNVNDAATRLLMERFYKGLLNKKTKLEALKEAQQYVRDYKMEDATTHTVQQPYQSPEYWAAFILLDALD
ncbi:MAG: CHAT domain-containing protein [Prevotellaceae bacterium]|nr:CHAT domain-containing protein [Prevotellaceae bacterium]